MITSKSKLIAEDSTLKNQDALDLKGDFENFDQLFFLARLSWNKYKNVENRKKQNKKKNVRVKEYYLDIFNYNLVFK